MRVAAIGAEPVHLVADDVAAGFEAAVVVVGGLVGLGDHAGRRIGEQGGDIGVGRRAVPP